MEWGLDKVTRKRLRYFFIMLSIQKLRMPDTLLIGYFSFFAYLLSLSKDFGYLRYFNIPVNFINYDVFDVFKEVNNLLIIIATLAFTYCVYQELFDYSSYLSEIRMKKDTIIRKIYWMFIRFFVPIIIPFIIFYLLSQQKISELLFSFLLALIFSFALGAIEFRFLMKSRGKNNFKEDHNLIKLILFQIMWLLSNFIIFWSVGIFQAKNLSSALSFDEGRSAVIYFSDEKAIAKSIINNKLSQDSDFSIVSLKDSTYNFQKVFLDKDTKKRFSKLSEKQRKNK